MNKNNIREILDKTDINVLDEINILEYIDELEQTKEEYIKSLDKLDVLQDRIDKAIEYITHEWFKREQIGISHLSFSYDELQHILDILRGNNDN